MSFIKTRTRTRTRTKARTIKTTGIIKRVLNSFNRYVLSLFLCLAAPMLSQAQSLLPAPEAGGHTFSYTIIDADVSAGELLVALQAGVLSRIAERGATLYAVWTPAQKPTDAPFAGLKNNQVSVMLAWSDSPERRLSELDRDIKRLDAVTVVSSRLFDAIYLPEGLDIPTAQGFYVHREEKYGAADVNDAVRLSKEAWQTWESAWGVKVVGLFREIQNDASYSNLNRIAWYPSYEAWLATRNNQDQESAKRFQARRQLLIEGSGIAIATDRAVPLIIE